MFSLLAGWILLIVFFDNFWVSGVVFFGFGSYLCFFRSVFCVCFWVSTFYAVHCSGVG